jgi:hypothetical protein
MRIGSLHDDVGEEGIVPQLLAMSFATGALDSFSIACKASFTSVYDKEGSFISLKTSFLSSEPNSLSMLLSKSNRQLDTDLRWRVWSTRESSTIYQRMRFIELLFIELYAGWSTGKSLWSGGFPFPLCLKSAKHSVCQ